MSTVRVLIADDQTIIRDGLKALIEKEAGMEGIAEAENGRKTIRLAQELHPNVVIMDVSAGHDQKRQCGRNSRVRVIALSMPPEK
jgi:DNA-binding NarL/FixJ family response regulator